jgi:hypothetical protein
LGVEFAEESASKEKLQAVLGTADAGAQTDPDEDGRRGLAAANTSRVTVEEREKLLAYVKEGHALLYVPYGAAQDPVLDALHVKIWRADEALGMRTQVPAQPSSYTQGVERLESKVKAFFGLPSDGVPLLVDQYTFNITAAAVPLGQGRVVLVGAPELASNAALARADNAQFWLSALSSLGRGQPVHFDEFHHGFSDDRSVAEFARRYGLQFAAAQLLLGLCLWAFSLRRFGRPATPPEDQRVAATDALFAQSRLYREGQHQAFAAQLLANGLVQELATASGESPRAGQARVEEALRRRGRPDLAGALAEVSTTSAAVKTESDLLRVAQLAAKARQLARTESPPPSKRSNP